MKCIFCDKEVVRVENDKLPKSYQSYVHADGSVVASGELAGHGGFTGEFTRKEEQADALGA